MYWAPGGTPEVLGDYILPERPFLAIPGAERQKAVFGNVAFPAPCVGAAFSFWHWQPDAQPPLRPLPGLWSGRIGEMVSLHRDDLIIQHFDSVSVVDSRGQLVATLVEDREPIGTAVSPEGEIAVFLLQRDDQRGLDLDLTIFSATLEEQQSWEAIYRHGTFNDWLPFVEPVWHGNEVLFLALDDRQPDTRPTYHLRAFDVTTGSVRSIAGPFTHARRMGPSHYALSEDWEAPWTLFDAAAMSFRALPRAAELGLQPSQWFPIAVNGEWMVVWSGSELLAWHPTAGVTRLGPADPATVFTMGEGFGWWVETPGSR